MKSLNGPREAANLSKSIQHQVNMYALAAGAAGVGSLCLAQPAEARIVYTPANVRIVKNGGLITFDLNHDGIADFGLSNSYQTFSENWVYFVRAAPTKRVNEIWGKSCPGSQSLCAAALSKGTKIGPKGQFSPDFPAGEIMLISNGAYYTGKWRNVTGYLGLKFVIKGKTHFGWARVKVSTHLLPPHVKAVLTGFAYETVPNKAIIAGKTKGPDAAEEQPATLGRLALGKE